ncbi:D-Ala-D-Ala carboxypeptidase family metallohydrolase [Polyangium sp. y55x31]|uniref:YcbK family protein n=1 Tax=Polyangium sp. y55x31 TaxID=3042688 RepID=UPI00248211FB|nr:D-Ala-D-Ala carboxypeptidase family metallohydrolase [Polyangium sp. y55x31]MDI1477529.1 D-Ala-D-Ala carboxypeptidase family metallohydrolase [Polyangium sp. y55x31]
MTKLVVRSDQKAPRIAMMGIAAIALAAATQAHAGPLLDQPPKLYTFKLDDPSAPRLGLLRSYLNAEVESPGPLRRYIWGPFGQWRNEPWLQLAWRPAHAADDAADDAADEPDAQHDDLHAFASSRVRLLDDEPAAGAPLPFFRASSDGSELLRIEPDVLPSWSWNGLDPARAPALLASTGPSFASNGFDSLWAPPPKPVRDWRCRRRPVIFVRGSGERDVFPLVRCDGSVAPEALDRLSLMMRPADVARPADLLPDEPDPEATRKGEWIADVRLVHPRLLWALQRIADSFPWRPIYIYSGYRPGAKVAGTSHQSMHAAARAADIQVHGIPNATVFQLCRTLDDVGCGFYPNSKFVHVDVRRPGTGHALWIDASGPSEPPQYVDSWPGVLEKGGMAWAPSQATPGVVEWSGRLPSGASMPAPPRYGGPP